MIFLICAVQRISILVGIVMVFQGKNCIMGLMNKSRFVVVDWARKLLMRERKVKILILLGNF